MDADIRKRLDELIGEAGPIWDVESVLDKIAAEFWVIKRKGDTLIVPDGCPVPAGVYEA